MALAGIISAVTVALALVSCTAGRAVVKVPDAPPSAEVMAQFWVDPGTQPRDLFWGSGGKRYAPPGDADYELVGMDDTGFSTSFDVTSPDKVEWSAKIGAEAQTEVVLSRILWGLGYHQPPIYYLPSWRLKERGGTRTESEARFRPKIAILDRQKEYWHWQDNPFGATPQFKGLLVTLLMMNSTDLKNDNNSIYELKEPWHGARRWFVVRDLGAALGETGKLYPRRNWIDGFEKQGFILGVEGQKVRFDYDGRHQELLDILTPADVRWAAERMRRLTDAQWRDAFRAANYSDALAERFIRRIKQKIADGLAVGS